MFDVMHPAAVECGANYCTRRSVRSWAAGALRDWSAEQARDGEQNDRGASETGGEGTHLCFVEPLLARGRVTTSPCVEYLCWPGGRVWRPWYSA